MMYDDNLDIAGVAIHDNVGDLRLDVIDDGGGGDAYRRVTPQPVTLG